MGNIEDVATNIKHALIADPARDLEFLARLFADDTITDTGTGNEVANRLTTILAASADAKNNGVTHFSGIYSGCHDLGFRTEFKDMWPSSDNQVGHLTTGVDMGFRPLQSYANLRTHQKALLFFLSGGTPEPMLAEYICIRLIIGHEQVADDDPDPDALKKAAKSPSASEINLFLKALSIVTEDSDQNPHRALSILQGIRVPRNQKGNSMQDLLLSLFGFKFGQMIRAGTIDSRAEAARWIRTNLGEVEEFPEEFPKHEHLKYQIIPKETPRRTPNRKKIR